MYADKTRLLASESVCVFVAPRGVLSFVNADAAAVRSRLCSQPLENSRR